MRALAAFIAVFLIAGTHHALAQQCPPNSHARAVAFAGSLRSAQCFCNIGYRPVSGVCVPIKAQTQPQPNDPSRSLVQPRPQR